VKQRFVCLLFLFACFWYSKEEMKRMKRTKEDKKMLLAIVFVAFGLLLFIALALTLPWVL